METVNAAMQFIEPEPVSEMGHNQVPENRLQPEESLQGTDTINSNGNHDHGKQQRPEEFYDAVGTKDVSEINSQPTAGGNDGGPRYSLVSNPAEIGELVIHNAAEVEDGSATSQSNHKEHDKEQGHYGQKNGTESSPHRAETKETGWRNFSPMPHIPNAITNITNFGRLRGDRPAEETVPLRQYEKLYKRYEEEKAEADELHHKYLDRNHRLKKAEAEITRLTNSLRQGRDDWNREKREMMRDMQKEAAKKEDELKRQKKELSNKVFDLAGGIEYASHDQLTKMLEGWKGGVGNLSPSYFTEVDFSNDIHREIIQSSQDDYFRILKDYGGKVLWSLFDSMISNSILDRTQSYFCIGADEALVQGALKVDQTLLNLEGFVVQNTTATDANSILETWRSNTVRMLLSLIGADVRLLADYSSRVELVRKSPALEHAINAIVSQVMEDTNRFILPNFDSDGSQKQKSERQIKKHREKLGDIVTCAVVLCLNMRLSPHKLTFWVPLLDKEVNPTWMKCVGGESQMDPEKPPKVLFVISPAVMKRGETRWECIVKADVFPA